MGTWAEFKRKWSRYKGKESSAYQEHFNDLCRLLGQLSPAEADPTGSDSFCFQKRVIKDVELMVLKEDGSEYKAGEERGFADVWKKDCFAWEYKGKKKNLDEAYKQLLRYRESLLNPPLLVVCDFDRYIIRTNFNGIVQETHEFTNADIDQPRNLSILRALFTDPDFLKPQRTTAQITEHLAGKIAEVARSLQGRESVELADARTRKEVRVAEKQNLRIARFLNRIIFCFFAEDVGLLPPGIFTEVATAGLDDPRYFAERLGALFRVMAKGGSFGAKKVRHFNGHLFDEATVFELTLDEIKLLAEASEADWQFIEPSIMGTLFERALDDNQRAKLGAHYTSEADIKTLVEPVLMQPLRGEWKEIKRDLVRSYAKGKGNAADRTRLEKFHKKLSALTVLDPACGSGNFLYVSLQLLLGLEKELIAFATALGFQFKQRAGVHQLKAIEINPYAFELAQVSVQIGYLQWMRDNGFPLERSHVLQVLDGFQNEDALLVPHYSGKAKTLKQARAKEHETESALKFYTEREWPETDVIVSNPPFLGDKFMRRELTDEYVGELRRVFIGRIPGQSDLCCYWFEKARQQIKDGECKRAGLLATQGIRGGANREVLERIKETGDIFFAVSDREWILDGANVHVSMVGFDDGTEKLKMLDGKTVVTVNPQLTSTAPTASAKVLTGNEATSFIGTTKKAPLDIEEELAIKLLLAPNPTPKPNSDVVLPWMNGLHVTRREPPRWIIDFPIEMGLEDAARFESPFAFVEEKVHPLRVNHREAVQTKYWWRQARPCPELRALTGKLTRYCVTPRVAKHRLVAWIDAVVVPDCQLVAFARDDNYFFGVVHSRFHEVWALAQGTQLREKESGFRYTPTTCFETFPLPQPTPEQQAAIAAAAKELNKLRERWLNPPEWTREEVLEFPASVTGPWSRYVKNGVARYPRLVPKDADCAKKLKERTLTNLYNQRPAWLDLAHKKLDIAVAAAYGWLADLTDEQILERLLKLNLERAAAEAKAAQTKKPKTSRAKREDEMI